jgi:hypothetical protein
VVELAIDENLIGRCGLYCGICEIYRAGRDSQQLREKLAERHHCLPEEVRCDGCQALGISGWSHEREWGTNCKILKCLNARDLMYCHECAQYETCLKYAEFAEICSGLGMDLPGNLEKIRQGKAREWLLEEDRKWRCPRCGQPIIVSYDFKDCHWCGQQFREGEDLKAI